MTITRKISDNLRFNSNPPYLKVDLQRYTPDDYDSCLGTTPGGWYTLASFNVSLQLDQLVVKILSFVKSVKDLKLKFDEDQEAEQEKQLLLKEKESLLARLAALDKMIATMSSPTVYIKTEVESSIQPDDNT